MNPLLMIVRDQGVWVARVQNTDVEYWFKVIVEEPDFNFLCVQSFALGMQADRAGLIDAVRTGMDIGQTTPEVVVDQLVNETNALALGEETIFTAEVGNVLADELVEAGEALLTALG